MDSDPFSFFSKLLLFDSSLHRALNRIHSIFKNHPMGHSIFVFQFNFLNFLKAQLMYIYELWKVFLSNCAFLIDFIDNLGEKLSHSVFNSEANVQKYNQPKVSFDRFGQPLNSSQTNWFCLPPPSPIFENVAHLKWKFFFSYIHAQIEIPQFLFTNITWTR